VPFPLIIAVGISFIRLRGFDGSIVSIFGMVPLGDGPHRGRVIVVVIIMIIVHMCWATVHHGVASCKGWRLIFMDETLEVGLHVSKPKVFLPNPVIDYLSDLAETFCMATMVSGLDTTRDE
jgi:hypothetical protein